MKLKIGLVTSRFNEQITGQLKAGAWEVLKAPSPHEIEVKVLDVPGAVEIPLAAKWLFDQGFDGVVACGAVIRGDTTHYDLVCNSVERGVTHLMLEYGRPIGFGVITTENEEQAYARAGGEHGNKGADAAKACLAMLELKLNSMPTEPCKG
jgi:6,7-dimethyl-8-ribityllumazine synthase